MLVELYDIIIRKVSAPQTETTTMPAVSLQESAFLGVCFEGLFYGLYSGIFLMFLKYNASKESPGQTTALLFYSLCTLYILSVTLFATDLAKGIIANIGIDPLYPSVVLSSTLSGCCDFMAQSILIYRCWIVWNRNISVVIVPSILAVTFLALWIPGGVFPFTPTINWVYDVTVTSLVLSLTVNALVTGLIVFKIVKVYADLKPNVNIVSGGGKLRTIIFILIESGMLLLSFQLANIVLYFVRTDTATVVAQPITYILEMLNGITPTIIQVRVAMGLSFHDEESMVDATSSMCYGSDYPTLVAEGGSITLGQESRDDNDSVEASEDKNL